MADRNPNITDQTGADIVNKLRAMYGNTEVYKPSHQGRNPMLSDATGKAIAEALGNVSEGGVGGDTMVVEFSVDSINNTASTTTSIADIVAASEAGKALYAHAGVRGMNLYAPISIMTNPMISVVIADFNMGEARFWIMGQSRASGASETSSEDGWGLYTVAPMLATSKNGSMPSGFNAGYKPIEDLGAPTNATDAATKKYVDDSVGAKVNKTDTVLETTLSRGRLGTAGTGSFAFGNNATASGQYSTATGTMTNAAGKNATAGGESSGAHGDNSHAEGEKTKAQGKDSHAEGYSTSAQGMYSHAEGKSTVAQESAHAEGDSSVAPGASSHAEGKSTSAAGVGAHSEGIGTTAGAIASHAGGSYNTSMALYPTWVKNTAYEVGDRVTRSTAGLFSAYECITANSDPAFVNSKWKKLPSNTDKFFAIGNGIDADNRSDAMTLDIFGNMELQGDLTLFKGKANEMLLSSLLGSSGGGDSVFVATVRPNQALRDATASPLPYFTAQSPTYSYEFVTPVSDIRDAIAAGKKIFIQGALDATNGYSIIGSTATFMTNSKAPNLYVGYFQMIDFGYDMFKMYSAPNNYAYMPPTLMTVMVQMTQDGSVLSGQTSDCALMVPWAYSLKNIGSA